MLYSGPPSSSVDIVFIPDEDVYPSGPTTNQFLTDIGGVINAYYQEPAFNCRQDYLNFWIAMDSGDAHDNCDSDPPDNWDDDYTFAEAGAIAHNLPASQIRNCSDIDERFFSGDVNRPRVFLHETGHTVFGLADEYCNSATPPRGNGTCDGGYFMADPFPNLYEEPSDCTEDLNMSLTAWDASNGFPAPVCSAEFESDALVSTDWVAADPGSNHLMVDNGAAQGADHRRIEWLIKQCQNGGCGGTP